MQAKDFQQKALERLDLYLEKLKSARAASQEIKKLSKEKPELNIPVPDFTVEAWKKMEDLGQVGRSDAYSPRVDGIGNPVPCVTMKVPTGGGKTFLAVQGIAKILDQYFADGSEKFVLWVVPSEAIYSQTKAKLIDRDHPFRKLLDIASGGRVKILEKDSPLHRDDLKDSLTVMLLMLPSANRQDAVNKLRLFRDRGNVNGFLPPEDDLPAHDRLKRDVSNLDFIGQGDFTAGETTGIVRASLGNALRLVCPLIVLDEGHKAFSDLAHNTLYGFNPRFVLELSATPKDKGERKSNWLVNISGKALEAEDMIKLPMLVTVTSQNSWKDCLREAWQQIESLQAEADKLDANGLEYIRPILLVQVENTGKPIEGKIHADHARDHLISLGVSEDAIAIKTSDKDELKALEVRDLMDRANPIRAIITMQALQEGWDCPFAYVLCSLAVGRSASAMTQLVGRILRQPYVQKTSVTELNQSYVYTYHVETGKVVDQVRKSLESEGMGDLAGFVQDTLSVEQEMKIRSRREPFQKRDYYLPQVLVYEGDSNARLLDWETDILSAIDWESLHLRPDGGKLPKSNLELIGGVHAVDLSVLEDGKSKLLSVGKSSAQFDRVFAVRSLQEHVPNPWIAYDWVEEYTDCLKGGGWTEEELGQQQQYVIRDMVQCASKLVDDAAQKAFDEGLESGRIAFNLVAEKWWPNWEVPHKSEIAITQTTKRVRRADDSDLERDLFPPTYAPELNGLELKAACFVDRQEAVTWWYRNLVRGSAYGLQGWKRNRIYPDFIIAQEKEGALQRWLVLETKGGHLIENTDTDYKRKLMEKLNTAYANPPAQVGQLLLFESTGSYECQIVSETDWQKEILQFLTSD